MPLLLHFYNDLPHRIEVDKPAQLAPRLRVGLRKYKRAVASRYNEGTLQHLLNHGNAEVRQAAVLALGMMGTMAVNGVLADRLHDDDARVRELAIDALWSLWFRADKPDNNQELQRIMRLNIENTGPENILARYDALIQRAPEFAEAYNQRAILLFRLGELSRAIADCDKTLKLNPYHFGAAGGMAQCYMKQKKYRVALRNYRRANRINPNMDGIQQVIQSLEQMLGEEGKK
jgi:tetratricopeptide (TPR) repeat protein